MGFNYFLELFTKILDTGTQTLLTSILVVATFIAGIDFLLGYIYEYANDFATFFGTFISKIVKYAIYFAIIKSYLAIMRVIIKTIFEVGYLFFPDGGSVGNTVGFPDFDSIYRTLISNVLELEAERQAFSWYQIGSHLIYLILMFLLCVGIFLIVKEIIINFIEFKMTIAVGTLLLPFNLFEATKSMGQRLFSALLFAGAKLLFSVIATGLCLQAIRSFRYTANNGNINIGNSVAFVFLFLVCAWLVTLSRELANMLINGSAGTGGRSALTSALTVAAGGVAGAVVGGMASYGGLKGAFEKSQSAIREGKSVTGVFKDFKQGMKDGSKLAKNTRFAKFTNSATDFVKGTISYAGGKDLSSLPGDLLRGSRRVIDEQFFNHDSEALKEKKEALSETTLGSAKEYVNHFRIAESFNKAKESYKKAIKDKEISGFSAYELKNAVKEFAKTYTSKDLKAKVAEMAKEKFKDKQDFRKFSKDFAKNEWKIDRELNKYSKGKDTMGKYTEAKARERYSKEYEAWKKKRTNTTDDMKS